MRGLKPISSDDKSSPIVASFTDAWIETIIDAVITEYQLVASFTDAWIETGFSAEDIATMVSHLLQMRGLKQRRCACMGASFSRIFYRCVD